MAGTQTPWTLIAHSSMDVLIGAFEIRGMFGDKPGVYPVFQQNRSAIDGAVIYLHPDDARLIVQAVNSFEAMRAALRIAHAAIVGFNEDGTPRKGKQIMFTDEEREQIAEALKIAEGK